MSSIRRTADVPYSDEQMYALVDDIRSYPEFLHWCRAAQVTRRDMHFVEATLDVGLAGFHKQLTTRNSLEPPQRIGIALVNGPFRKLEGEWLFEPLARGCRVTLAIEFESKVSPFGMIFAAAFEEVARSQMRAFLARAEKLYGT